jgi:diguanylate cyclase (GGDEF)-like protein
VDEVDQTGVSLELLERLRPHLAESLMVLDHDWTVRANLAPPGGLIGQGLGVGVHTLEDMHPDDAVQVMELGAQAFATGPGWQGSKVVRMRRGDGTYGRYEITAINMFDDPVVAGMVVRTREVLQDVADDLSGLDTGSTIETVAELLPIGLLLLDARGRVVFANDAACTLLDRSPQDLKRSGLEVLVDAGDRPPIRDAINRLALAPGREECTVRLANGRADRTQCRFSAEGAERVTRIVVTLEDVTERHAERQDLEQRANHDALTGLRNRGSILTVIQAGLDAHEPITVAYIDLDGFKAVNDTWGHDRGDHLLVALAMMLRSGLAPGTEVARIGGDEFVVVATGAGDPAELVERLHVLVAGVTRAEGLAVTGSIGTATATSDDTPRDLIHRADQAMYSAKGRR